jgi:DNA-binding IclR family transcriptional regulator
MPTLIPAAARTMAVFEVFAREKRELSNSDIARALALPESSSSDLLRTLHALGYLVRKPRTRRFYPTARLLEAARRIAANDPLGAAAQEAVDQLAERSDESAFVGVLDGGAVKVLAARSSRQPLRYVIGVGDRISLHASALGRALLARLPAAEARTLLQAQPLRAVTGRTQTAIEPLLAALRDGSRRGWHELRSEGVDGVAALAVAGQLDGRPTAVSLAGPVERIDRRRELCLDALRELGGALFDPEPPPET